LIAKRGERDLEISQNLQIEIGSRCVRRLCEKKWTPSAEHELNVLCECVLRLNVDSDDAVGAIYGNL